jgi:hypothetical protein
MISCGGCMYFTFRNTRLTGIPARRRGTVYNISELKARQAKTKAELKTLAMHKLQSTPEIPCAPARAVLPVLGCNFIRMSHTAKHPPFG